jgi:phage shock protein A
MLSDSELIRTALDRDHELAVVLAERLSELLNVDAELAALELEMMQLELRCSTLDAELNAIYDLTTK